MNDCVDCVTVLLFLCLFVPTKHDRRGIQKTEINPTGEFSGEVAARIKIRKICQLQFSNLCFESWTETTRNELSEETKDDRPIMIKRPGSSSGTRSDSGSHDAANYSNNNNNNANSLRVAAQTIKDLDFYGI